MESYVISSGTVIVIVCTQKINVRLFTFKLNFVEIHRLEVEEVQCNGGPRRDILISTYIIRIQISYIYVQSVALFPISIYVGMYT